MIEYIDVKEDKIKEIIESEKFNVFKERIEIELCIQDVHYNIEILSSAEWQDGFPKKETNANLLFKEDNSEIDKIVFYTDSIAENIKKKFSRISCENDIDNKIVEIYVMNVLVHELIHINQFQNNELSKEIIESQKDRPYEQKTFEKDAIEKSREIMSFLGKFEKKILDCIFSNKFLDDSTIVEIKQLYNTQFNINRGYENVLK